MPNCASKKLKSLLEQNKKPQPPNSGLYQVGNERATDIALYITCNVILTNAEHDFKLRKIL